MAGPAGRHGCDRRLTDARGPAFDLLGFHDRLRLEGDVPIAVQRWELLGTEPDLG